jgi:hypothetical protein
VALSVSCQSLSNGSGKQTTNNNPNLSTARLIFDFINTIDPKRTIASHCFSHFQPASLTRYDALS